MPDIDWTVTDASEQFIADTLWWLEEFDLDGLRIDAVKHVEDQRSGTWARASAKSSSEPARAIP